MTLCHNFDLTFCHNFDTDSDIDRNNYEAVFKHYIIVKNHGMCNYEETITYKNFTYERCTDRRLERNIYVKVTFKELTVNESVVKRANLPVG